MTCQSVVVRRRRGPLNFCQVHLVHSARTYNARQIIENEKRAPSGSEILLHIVTASRGALLHKQEPYLYLLSGALVAERMIALSGHLRVLRCERFACRRRTLTVDNINAEIMHSSYVIKYATPARQVRRINVACSVCGVLKSTCR